MATITVRDLPDDVRRRLKQRAANNNRSMEAEVREILSTAVATGDFADEWIRTTAPFRGDPLPVPARSLPREVDLT